MDQWQVEIKIDDFWNPQLHRESVLQTKNRFSVALVTRIIDF